MEPIVSDEEAGTYTYTNAEEYIDSTSASDSSDDEHDVFEFINQEVYN